MLVDPKFKDYKIDEMLKKYLEKNPLNIELDGTSYNQEYVEKIQSIYLSNARKKIKFVDGMYLCGLNMNHELDEEYVSHTYGIADNYQQILEYHKDLIESNLEFVCFVTPIYKKDQLENGGWRWHKWGNYIGNHKIEHEYLYDEKDIEVVYVYHFFLLDRSNLNIKVTNKTINEIKYFKSINELNNPHLKQWDFLHQ